MTTMLLPGAFGASLQWLERSKRDARTPPANDTVTELVDERASEHTGQRLVGILPLVELWDRACCERRESLWHELPDAIVDAVEAHNLVVNSEMLRWLSDRIHQADVEAVVAVRALSLIGELCHEDDAIRRSVRDLLLGHLGHARPAIRVAVAEAFWLLVDRAAREDLAHQLETEQHPTVRKTLEQALRVLR
jgi:hypothetical protein